MTEQEIARIAAGLSEAQKTAMLADRSQGQSSYAMGVAMNSLKALAAKGLVLRKGGLGEMFCPRTNIDWPLTAKGLAVRSYLEGSDQ
jgi:aspartate oxidase